MAAEIRLSQYVGQGAPRRRRRRRARRAHDHHQALRGRRPGRPLLPRPGEALALGLRAGRHQRERQHQGRGRLPAGPPRGDRLRRRLPRQPAARQGHGRRRARASSTCSTAWACPSTARPRACSTSAASAARSSTAPPSRARPPASSSSTRSTSRCAAARPSTSRTTRGAPCAGERMVRKFEFWDFLGARARRRRDAASAASRRT